MKEKSEWRNRKDHQKQKDTHVQRCRFIQGPSACGEVQVAQCDRIRDLDGGGKL